MPLYDCMLLLKPHVTKEALMDLVARVGKQVHQRNGVVTDIKSFGTVHTGYKIGKRDGKYYQGKLMQMTMMVNPNFNNELHYLNKEDRLLRWLLIKHRNTKFGIENLGDDDNKGSFNKFRSPLFEIEGREDDSDDDDEEYEVDDIEEKQES